MYQVIVYKMLLSVVLKGFHCVSLLAPDIVWAIPAIFRSEPHGALLGVLHPVSSRGDWVGGALS